MFTFLTNIQFFIFFDWRWVAQNLYDLSKGQLLPSDGGYADLSSQAGLPPYNAGLTLATLCGAASEELMSAAAIGARYQRSDLTQYGGNLVVKVAAALVAGSVLGRRVRATDIDKLYGAAYESAQGMLEALRRGERIFDAVPNVEAAGAGPVAAPQFAPGISPPLWTWEAQRYFGLPASGQRPQG